jgi:hypothetical protein
MQPSNVLHYIGDAVMKAYFKREKLHAMLWFQGQFQGCGDAQHYGVQETRISRQPLHPTLVRIVRSRPAEQPTMLQVYANGKTASWYQCSKVLP